MVVKFRKKMKTKTAKFVFNKRSGTVEHWASPGSLFIKGHYEGMPIEGFIHRGASGKCGGCVIECDTMRHCDMHAIARAIAAACKFNKVRAD